MLKSFEINAGRCVFIVKIVWLLENDLAYRAMA
jgi:hypothetical protein